MRTIILDAIESESELKRHMDDEGLKCLKGRKSAESLRGMLISHIEQVRLAGQTSSMDLAGLDLELYADAISFVFRPGDLSEFVQILREHGKALSNIRKVKRLKTKRGIRVC